MLKSTLNKYHICDEEKGGYSQLNIQNQIQSKTESKKQSSKLVISAQRIMSQNSSLFILERLIQMLFFLQMIMKCDQSFL